MQFIDLKRQQDIIKPELDRRIAAVLAHGRYILGPEVTELEDRLQDYTGAKYCITVSSGTDALLISLMALGICPGDEVITTPFTFVATAEVIALLGAIPVFVDIEPDTCNIDPARIEEHISDKTRAIIPVSLYGQVADMDGINKIAGQHDIPVIEDAAQSFGATYKNRKSCNLSTIGCTSFFPSKPLGCYGDGGAIFTNDAKIAQAVREIRVHGQSERYVHTRVGIGGRMDTLQCAVILAKLDEFINNEVAARVETGAYYNALFDKEGIQRIRQRPDCMSVFAQYTIFVKNRNDICEKLGQAGIPTAVHYPVPLNRQVAYADICNKSPTPLADKASEQVMSLPMHPYLDKADQDVVCDNLVQALGTNT